MRCLYFLLSIITIFASNGSSQEAGKTCYPSVGCFSTLSPWTSMTRQVPSPRHPMNVSTYMYYYSRAMPNGTLFNIFPDIDLSEIPQGDNKQTYMVIHGQNGNGTFPWIFELKDALLTKEDANVFVAEYNQVSRGSYEQTASDARIVGKLAMMVLDALDVEPSYIHLIGHCTGGHAVSYAAKYLQEAGKQPARLTALNPAGPLFEGESLEIRVTPEDADLVDVWHTDITYPGIKSPCGHVDFYFNGGKLQPGCDASENINEFATCSHRIAHDYYVEAVRDDCMMGQPADLLMEATGKPLEATLKLPSKSCMKEDVCAPAGLGISKSLARGIFIVFTNKNSPYCVPA